MKRAVHIIPICGLLLAGVASADTITKPHTFSAGTPAQAEQVNANFDTVYGQVNKVGAAITVDGWNNVGIGTATPAGELHVSKPTELSEIFYSGGAAGNNLVVDVGNYSGSGVSSFLVRVVDAAPAGDVIEYSSDGGATWSAPASMVTSGLNVGNNVLIGFSLLDGHLVGDQWAWKVTGYPGGLIVSNGKVTVRQLAVTGGASGEVLTSDAFGNATWQASATDNDGDPANELQTISRTGSDLTLSRNGGTVSIADDDSDPANELQTISRTGSDLILSRNGGTVSIADDDSDPANEIQTLSLTLGELTLSKGGGSVTISDGDGNSANEFNSLVAMSGATLQVTDGGGVKSVDLAEKLGVANLSDGKADASTIYLGNDSGAADTGGHLNTGIGAYSLYSNTSGSENTATGLSAMESNTSGSYNVASGSGALLYNSTGSSNVGIGYLAGQYNMGGSNNTYVGANAGGGMFGSVGDQSGNIFIGAGAGSQETGSNQLYIDNSSTVLPLIHGDFASDTLTINGNMRTSQNVAIGGVAVSSDTTLYVAGDTDDTYAGRFVSNDNWGTAYGITGRATTDASSTRYSGNFHTGVYGHAGGSFDNYGVYGYTDDYSAHTNAGLYGIAHGGTNAYGVRGYADGGANNYAGYFEGNLHATGNLTYVGELTDVSDERLKENIRPVENGLAKVAALRGVYFNMKDNPGQTEVGVIAQDVQKVLPEAVSVIDKENGYLGVSYPSLIPLLIEAVKELQAENTALKILVCQDHPEADICR